MAALLDRIQAQTQTVSTRAEAGATISRAADPVTLEEFSRILSNPAGKSSTYGAGMSANRAMGITAWYSGARYIAETVSMLPWKHYMKIANDERTLRAD